MSFATSPYERVRNAGLRIIVIRAQLFAAGWDTASLNAALQALRDDNGGIPLPDGVNETAPVMRAVFELRPQIMEQALSLYEREFKKAVPTLPAAPPALFRLQLDDGLGFIGDMIDGQSHAFSDPLGGALSTQIYTIFNDGAGPLTINSITVGGDVQTSGPPATAWGAALPAFPFDIPPMGSVDILIDFYAGANMSPVPQGIYNMSINIEHNGGNEPSPFTASLVGDSN